MRRIQLELEKRNDLHRTLAEEEPEIVSVAVRPGIVDTNVCLVLDDILLQSVISVRRCKAD